MKLMEKEMKDICKRYIEMVLVVRAKEEAIAKAFSEISELNSVVTVIPEEVDSLLNELMIAKVGTSVFEWLDWWVYEVDCKASKAYIDEIEFTVDSFESLWEVIERDCSIG
jgi:hypothetical protein